MTTEEKELAVRLVRVGENTLKGIFESVGVLPQPSPEERLRRLGESVELIVRACVGRR